MRIGQRIAAGLALAFGVVALVPSSAGAATVQTTTAGDTHTLSFAAAPGEQNTVTVALAPITQTPDANNYYVTDSTAPLTAGAGCSGGGAPGSTVTCSLPKSVYGCTAEPFCPPIPAVSIELDIDLGDGDDSVDTAGIPGGDGGTGFFTLTEHGGDGADSFVDGTTSTRFFPGVGADHVVGGGGTDFVSAAGEAPDGPDLFDLRGDTHDAQVSYADATYPVQISFDDIANDGAAGEGDQLLGATYAIGGSGDDTMVAGTEFAQLEGRAGNDTLIGGPNGDFLFGESGDDHVRGNAGDDVIYGDLSVSTPPGNGRNDVLSGGPGNDKVQGDHGRDKVSGGAGVDELLGADGAGDDNVPDTVDCGAGKDLRASVGPEDTVRHCERNKTQRKLSG